MRGQASLKRSISETDLLVSEEEVNQIFASWKEDLVGITGLYGPVVDELLLVNVRDHGWDTEQYLSEGLVAAFEESERKTSEAYQKVFARHALHCFAQHRVVSETCVLVCSECVLGDAVGLCGYRLHTAWSCATRLKNRTWSLRKIPLEQCRARDEFSLMQQWARGRADDRVTLPADLETMDLHTIATSQPTLSAEPRRLRNDFEDSFDITRLQLISSAEIALPTLTSIWDLPVVDRLAGARSSQREEHRAGTGGDHSSVPALLRSHTSGRGVRAHDV